VQNQGQNALGDDGPDGDRKEEDNRKNDKVHTVLIGRKAPKFSPSPTTSARRVVSRRFNSAIPRYVRGSDVAAGGQALEPRRDR
jgi:hypothetical protein